MTADPMAEQIRSWDLLAAVAVSGAGHLVHNLAEFPPMALLGPETLAPIGITGLLTWAMVRRRSQVAYLAAAAWAAMVIVVGGASVHPLAIWPFDPAQTTSHYLAHVVYAGTQLPLLWVAGRWPPRDRRTDR